MVLFEKVPGRSGCPAVPIAPEHGCAIQVRVKVRPCHQQTHQFLRPGAPLALGARQRAHIRPGPRPPPHRRPPRVASPGVRRGPGLTKYGWARRAVAGVEHRGRLAEAERW